MMVKATETYLGSNSNLLPREIGDTTEIALNTLVNDNFIENINDTSGVCDGYVLVTKIEEGYSYNPELKCGDSNTIGSSTEDGLVAYYTFDDFQEPTENLMYGKTMRQDTYCDAVIHGIEDDDRYFIKKTEYDTCWYAGIRIPSVSINPGEKYTFSLDIKSNVTIFRVDYDPNVTGGGYTGNDTGRNYYSKTPAYYTNVGEWTKLKATIGTYPDIISPVLTDVFCPYSSDILDTKIFYKNEQLEQKDHATPYTEHFRTGIIKDYSGNDKNANLVLNNTPTWEEENENGYYKFDGVDDQINLAGLDLALSETYNGEATVSMWINPKKYENGFAKFFAGFHYWTINEFGRLQNMIYKPLAGVNYWLESSKTIEIDEWTNIVYLIKENEFVKYYVNGDFDVEYINSDIGIVAYSNDSGIGLSYDEFYEGLMDEVKIYNRVLSAEEIEYQYNINKKKYNR